MWTSKLSRLRQPPGNDRSRAIQRSVRPLRERMSKVGARRRAALKAISAARRIPSENRRFQVTNFRDSRNIVTDGSRIMQRLADQRTSTSLHSPLHENRADTHGAADFGRIFEMCAAAMLVLRPAEDRIVDGNSDRLPSSRLWSRAVARHGRHRSASGSAACADRLYRWRDGQG